jgi:SAM-dependent methyltransferase
VTDGKTADGSSTASLSRRNKQAWDELYGRTDRPVWGRLPIGFLDEFLGYVTPDLTAASRVLDAGAGEGRNTPSLEATGARVSACDASLHGLRKLHAAFDASLGCAQCDLSALPFQDGVFDFVLLTDVIETLPDPDSALAEAGRVLKRGGMLLCNIPGRGDPIADQEMSPIDELGYLYQQTYFFRFVDEGAAAATLRSHGFTIAAYGPRRWTEDAHPGFRAYPHEHVSNVFLGVKS